MLGWAPLAAAAAPILAKLLPPAETHFSRTFRNQNTIYYSKEAVQQLHDSIKFDFSTVDVEKRVRELGQRTGWNFPGPIILKK